jgi:hypothetical protein
VAAAIAFFPWVTTDHALVAGPLRLLPYARGEAPGDLPLATQRDIDGILHSYSRHPASRANNATLLEVADWQTGMELTDEVAEKLFAAKHVVAFAAISKRHLFTSRNYANFHTYQLVAQRFESGSTDVFSFTTRRRDGGTTHTWASDEFAFHRPQHVDLHARIVIDPALVEALMSLPPTMSDVREAVTEFNAANTDSGDVPAHVEMVMTKSAFEWLFRIRDDAISFQHAINATLRGIDLDEPPAAGQMLERWKRRWNNARPLDAWARDFCVVRGPAAHGAKRDTEGVSVWSTHQHLAFSSMLFPLLTKKSLSDAGRMKLEPLDVERLKRVESYLMHDPFADDAYDEDEHVWARLDSEAFIDAIAPRFYGPK